MYNMAALSILHLHNVEISDQSPVLKRFRVNNFKNSTLINHLKILDPKGHTQLMQIEDQCTEMANWQHLFAPPKRHKKAVVMALIGLAGIGIAFGTAVAALIQQQEMRESLTTHGEAILEMRDHTMLALDTLHKLSIDMERFQLQALVAHNSYSQDRLFRGLQALQQQRLTIDLIPLKHLDKIYKKAQHMAHLRNQHFPLLSSLSLLELPAAYTSQAGMLQVQIFVPLTTEPLPMFRYVHVPLMLHDSTTDNFVFLDVQPEHSFIASYPRHASHVLLTDNDLRQCLQLHKHYLCTHTVTRLPSADSCLGALYLGSQERIKRWCTLFRRNERWTVHNIQSSKYILSSKDPLEISFQCQDQKVRDQWPPGQHEFHLPEGCHLRTENFDLVSAGLSLQAISETIPIRNWHLHADIMANISIPDLDLARQALGNSSTFRDIREEVLYHQSSSPFLNFLKIAGLTSLVLGCFILACCGLLRYNFRQQRASGPSVRYERAQGFIQTVAPDPAAISKASQDAALAVSRAVQAALKMDRPPVPPRSQSSAPAPSSDNEEYAMVEKKAPPPLYQPPADDPAHH